jgi:hypothetical protein
MVAADDYRILPSQLRFDILQSLEHGLGVAFVGKIREWFVFEGRQIDHQLNPFSM